MSGMEGTIEIQRPAQELYAFFLDLDRTMIPTDRMVRSVVRRRTDRSVPARRSGSASECWAGPRPHGPRHRRRPQPQNRLRGALRNGPTPLQPDDRTDGHRDADHLPWRLAARRALRLFPSLADWIGERNWRRRLRLTKMALESEATGPR